jgi:DUF1680 family protein
LLRTLLYAIAYAALISVSVYAKPLIVADVTTSPHAVVKPVAVNEVTWTDGFWADRTRVCNEHSIPAMWELMRGSNYKPFYEHFLIAADEMEGDYHGAPWNDGDFYKWIEAASTAIACKPNAELEAAIDNAVHAVIAAQRDDGYLHTPVLIRQRNGDATAKPFTDRNDFEVYNLGHLMTAGCVRFRATGKRDLLDAAERAAQFLETAFANPTPQMSRQAVCPSHYMGLIELYRTTRNERYLRLAQKVIDLRNVAAGVGGGGGDDNQDRIPFVEQQEAVGHAVRANYLYAGAADLYLETGDKRLLPPLEAVWRNVTHKKLYVTGACGALFDGASPDGSSDQSQITRIHQAYGRNYQLPSETAHNETCAAIGAVMWNWRRYMATGEGRHLDWIELAMHNAVLTGVSLEGTDYFYTNPLRVSDPPPIDLRWSREREPFVVSYCCPPNVVRTVAQLGGYAYSKAPGAVSVNLYGASVLDTTLEGDSLRIVQETTFPWSGDVTVRVEAAPIEAWTLRLRQPSWASEMSLQVNGKPEKSDVVDGYATIRREWRTGDEVTLGLPMPVVCLESHPLVEETRGQLTIKRGPIVYCLESADLPEGVAVGQVRLDPHADFAVHYDDDLLDGVAVIEADLPVVESLPWNSLYRPANETATRTIRAKFVPYYAWGNRGKGEMSVWIPRGKLPK